MEHSSISCGRTFLYILKHCRIPDLSPKQAILSQPTQVYLKRSLMLMLIFLSNSLAISTLNQVSTSCRVEFPFTLSVYQELFSSLDLEKTSRRVEFPFTLPIFQELFHPSTMEKLPAGLNFLSLFLSFKNYFHPSTTKNLPTGLNFFSLFLSFRNYFIPQP